MAEYEQKASIDLDQPARVHQPAHLLAETAQIPHIPIPPIPKDKASGKSKNKGMNWKEREVITILSLIYSSANYNKGCRRER